jgi:hypothetical protein
VVTCDNLGGRTNREKKFITSCDHLEWLLVTFKAFERNKKKHKLQQLPVVANNRKMTGFVKAQFNALLTSVLL